MEKCLIDIVDPDSILSRNQKKRIKNMFLSTKSLDPSVLDSITYPEHVVDKYNRFSIDQAETENHWIISFFRTQKEEETPPATPDRKSEVPVPFDQIEIQDPHDILSKTQKKKIRQFIHKIWKGEEEFYDQLDLVLDHIVYPEGFIKKYNLLSFDCSFEKKTLFLHFNRQEEISPDQRRQELRKKLHAKFFKNKEKQQSQDPTWKTYYQLKSRLPHMAEKFLPNPDQVMANLEIYRGMLQNMPNNHPVAQYLRLMILN